MAEKPENNLPKVPPFLIPGAFNQHTEEPVIKNAHMVQAPKNSNNNDDFFSQRGLVSLAISLISLVSLGISMFSGAWFAYGILKDDNKDTPAAAPVDQAITPTTTLEDPTTKPSVQPADEALTENTQNQILAPIIVIGLVFAVGWISGLLGIRVLGNLILPFFIRFYAILTVGGILYLQFRIIEKLFLQEYLLMNFIKYLTLFGTGILALVLLHLMLEKHNLVFFGVLILFTSLAHLYLIAFHYVFVDNVNYNKLWGDIIFFLVTTTTSALMMAHFGLLNGIRRFIARMFNPKDNQFVPPN